MKTKQAKAPKAVGDTLVGLGGMLCVLAVIVYVLTASNGAPNGFIIFGGCTLGLLMVIAGYLKRISAALVSRNAEPPV